MNLKHLKSTEGFTIIELMIALSVLSVILLMSTVILIQIGNLYNKGINAANLQNSNRNVISDISAAIEFSGHRPLYDSHDYAAPSIGNMTIHSFCLGKTRYSYVLNRQLNDTPSGTDQTYHALWRDTITTTTSCPPLDLTNSGIPTDSLSTNKGYEMVPQNMRLTNFDVSEASTGSNIYNVNVWMAYGDSDLLKVDGTGHYHCSGDVGTQFCATSELNTTITRRLN